MGHRRYRRSATSRLRWGLWNKWDGVQRRGAAQGLLFESKMNIAKEKGTFPCPFRSEEQEEQFDYMFRTRRDGLAFRNRMTARPSRPVPSRNREPGSGTGLPLN